MYEFLKRLFDVLLAGLLLVLLSPLMVSIAIVIRVTMGSPVLFRQWRPGLNERPFEMLKFRTMTNEKDDSGNLLPDAVRLTRLGRFLRRTSLDELPELINVLRGDMSFVGPRPLLMRYLPYYSDEERLRHTVRPGITGWSQVTGRNDLPWDERLQRDIWYVKNRSLWLDLRILLMTIGSVLKARGVVVDPQSTMRSLDQERAGDSG